LILQADELIISDLNKGEEFWSFKKDGDRDYVHGLFAYPAMMVPKMQREILSVFKNRIPDNKPLTIFDPFMGSGTIMVEGMLQGANIIGVDINPLAYLVSKVKTTIYSIPRLQKNINNLLENIKINERIEIETDFNNIEKWFKFNVIHDLEHIKRQIRLEPSLKIRRFMWVAFSETVRSVSNSRSSTYKLHIKESKSIDSFDKDVIKVFISIIEKNFYSVQAYQEKLEDCGYIVKENGRSKYISTITIKLGDSIKESKKICKQNNPNLIITSPPYGDNHTTVTYGQYSVLALRWIDLIDIGKNIDIHMVESLSEIDKRSMGGKSCPHNIENNINNLMEISPTLKQQIDEIRLVDENKVDKILSFYYDFHNAVKSFAYVQSNTYVVMTVGNRTVAKKKIKMDQILLDLFSNNDFDFVYKFDRNILNKRMPVINFTDKKTGIKSETITKEYVLILKKR